MIDILLATYNGEKYLEEQIVSLLLQSNQDFRIIARDDGSTDGTVDILKKYSQKYGQRFVWIEGKPTGSAQGNFFELLRHSDAEYSMFCDQDDVWLNIKIERTLGCMKDGEEEYGKQTPLLVHTDLVVTDSKLKPINKSFIRMQKLNAEYNTLNRLIVQNNVTGNTVMVNRALRKIVVESSGALMHDWWLALIASAFGQVLFYPRATVVYRQHGENEVGAKDVSSGEYFKEKMQDKGGIRSSICATYEQAQAFLEAYENKLSQRDKAMLQEYAGLSGCGKWKRFSTLRKYRLFKSGLYRKVAQILYG